MSYTYNTKTQFKISPARTINRAELLKRLYNTLETIKASKAITTYTHYFTHVTTGEVQSITSCLPFDNFIQYAAKEFQMGLYWQHTNTKTNIVYA